MNLLFKGYTPPTPPQGGTPPIAPTPAWTEKKIRTERRCYGSLLYDIIDPVTGEIIGIGVHPGFCENVTVIEIIEHPATPGSPGSPSIPGVPADYNEGWNAGAVSNDPMTDNGQFAFEVPSSTTGAVCGLSETPMSAAWGEFHWAFKVSSTSVEVVEKGATKVAGIHNLGRLVIARVGPQIRYFVDDELVYMSTVAVRPGITQLWGCSALYRGLDSIADAEFQALSVDYAGTTVDDFAGELGPLLGWFSEDGAASLTGRLGSLVGEFSGESNVLTGVLGGLKASMGGGGLSAILEGELTQLTGTFETGLLPAMSGELNGYLQPLSSFMIGLPGGIGQLEGTLGQLQGFLTNVGFAVMQGTLGGLIGRFATPQWLRPRRFEMTGAMECGLTVIRVPRPVFSSVGSMSVALETGKTLAGVMATTGGMVASLQVQRIFEGAFVTAASMACGLDVIRTLRPDVMQGVGGMGCDLQITRVLRALMAGVGTLGLEGDDGLRVTRGIPGVAGEEITITLDDGSDVADSPPGGPIDVEVV